MIVIQVQGNILTGKRTAVLHVAKGRRPGIEVGCRGTMQQKEDWLQGREFRRIMRRCVGGMVAWTKTAVT